MMLKNKKGAMEMSMGTIVTIVLLMSVLVLGIFFVQKIFVVGEDAVELIDDQLQNEIAKLFSEKGKSLMIYPDKAEIRIKAGGDPKGFAFLINNKEIESRDYQYTVFAQPNFDFAEKCGSTMTQQKADSYLQLASGTISLGPGRTMDRAELVRFKIPETAPPCSIPYRLEIDDEEGPFQAATVWMDII